MKIRTILFSLLFVVGACMSVSAQSSKVGFTNVEILLNYMPDTKTIEKQLQTYQQKLEERIQIKSKYGQDEMMTYQEGAKANKWSPEQIKEWEVKLQKLSQEVEQAIADAEQKLMAKRNELLGPIQTKIQDAINDVAEENGYAYILNQSIGDGVPSIVYGAKGMDVTPKIAAKLGITLPE